MLLSRILNTIGVLALLLTVTFTSSAQTSDADIRSLLEARDTSIKGLLGPVGSDVPDAQREQLRDVVNGFLDFGAMAEAALGPHWGDLDDLERSAS